MQFYISFIKYYMLLKLINYLQNVVEAVYHLSEAYNHGRLVGMVSATGSISKIVFFDGSNAYVKFQISLN